MTKNMLLIAALVLSAAIFSCKKKDNCEDTMISKEKLQGNWKENSSRYGAAAFRFRPEYLLMKFENDSFFIEMKSQTDAPTISCPDTSWIEYTKGVFTRENSTLLLKGIYTDSNHVIKTSGCHHIGAYNDSFKVDFCKPVLKLTWTSPGAVPETYRTIDMYKE